MYPGFESLFLLRNKTVIKKNYSKLFEAVILIIIRGIVVQLVRAPPCHGGSCEFESRQSRFKYTDFQLEIVGFQTSKGKNVTLFVSNMHTNI
jgi:hypothetical protein